MRHTFPLNKNTFQSWLPHTAVIKVLRKNHYIVACRCMIVIWHIVSLSFNECLFSLMTSKCDSLVLGLTRKALSFTCHNPAVSKVAIIPLHSSPLLHLSLNYPTTFTRLLTAVLAGVSFPDALTSPDGKLVSADSHQLKQLTSFTNMPFYLAWGDGSKMRRANAA